MAGGASELDFGWDMRTLVQTDLDSHDSSIPGTEANRWDTTACRNPKKPTKVAANALLTCHSSVLGSLGAFYWSHFQLIVLTSTYQRENSFTSCVFLLLLTKISSKLSSSFLFLTFILSTGL